MDIDLSHPVHAGELEKKIQIAFDFDISPVISRYAQDGRLTIEAAQLHATEFLRYVVISTVFPNERWPMAGAADNFWHTFLLFSRVYREFCFAVCGKFLDHEPLQQEVTEEDNLLYKKFIAVYYDIFREEAPASVWPDFNSNFKVLSPGFKILLP